MYLETLNKCVKSTRCQRSVSLNCFSGALKTAPEK